MHWDILGKKGKQTQINPTAESPPGNFSFAGKAGEAGAGLTKKLGLRCTASK